MVAEEVGDMVDYRRDRWRREGDSWRLNPWPKCVLTTRWLQQEAVRRAASS